MEKIDTSEIRGKWETISDKGICAGDDTITSIHLVADKVNEIIEYLNKLPT